MKFVFFAFLLAIPPSGAAQEASAGFDLRATVSGMAASSNGLSDPVEGGIRAVLYPTWKVGDHWSVTGAWQLYSQPYFFENFATAGHAIRGNLLQGSLNYSRTGANGSVVLRVGELSSAFGSFLLRYDDASNPLVDLPGPYGYYYAAVSTLAVAGAQVDVTSGRWDARLQLANSSPANPRSVFARDQYGNWAGGAGYTIRQGLRVGFSAYRGPYLDRTYKFFRSNEANPNTLPASAWGIEAQWAHGHWNVQGEWQKFILAYKAVPDFHERGGYVEARRDLHPRWYVAGRAGYLIKSYTGNRQTFEGTAGFRINGRQLIKADYELQRSGFGPFTYQRTVALQLVTSLHPLAVALN